MKDKYLRIFFYDLSMLFGKFELNENFISIFNAFVRDNLNPTTIDCFKMIIKIKKGKDGYDAGYVLDDFINANNDIIDDKTKDLFKDVSLEKSNMISELAVAFKEYLESVVSCMSNNTPNYIRQLKQ